MAIDKLRGGIYVTGFSIGSLGPQVNAGGQDLIAIKFNRRGELQWIRQFGTPEDDDGYAIAVDHHQHLYISGFVSGDLDGSGPDVHAGDYDFAVIKIRKNGDLTWSRQLGTEGNDFGLGVAVGIATAKFIAPVRCSPISMAPAHRLTREGVLWR